MYCGQDVFPLSESFQAAPADYKGAATKGTKSSKNQQKLFCAFCGKKTFQAKALARLPGYRSQ